MIRVLLFSFVILTSGRLYAQTTLEKVQNVLSSKDFSKLKEFIDSTGLHRNLLFRNVTPEFYEGVLDFMNTDEHHVGKENYFPKYTVEFIVSKTTIVHYRVIGYKLCKVLKKNRRTKDYEEYILSSYSVLHLIKMLNTSFKDIFGKDIDTSELFNTKIVFAVKCGFVPHPTLLNQYISSLVKKRKKQELIKWLQSPCTEKQFYAIDGLYKLDRLGVPITNKERKMIEFVLNKKGSIYVCNTCVNEYMDISEFTELYKF